MSMRGRTWLVLAASFLSMSDAAFAGRLALSCDPEDGSYATGSYSASDGDWFVSDAFPDCVSPEFWNGVGSNDDEGPFTYLEEGTVRSDGTSVTSRVGIELGHPLDGWSSLSISTGASGFFRVPQNVVPGIGKVPAKLRFVVARGGVVQGSIGARVEGPGVDLYLDLDELTDGVREYDVNLRRTARYDFFVGVSGGLDGAGSGFHEAQFYVAVPEPAAPLLAATGAAVLVAAATTRRRGSTTR